MQPMGDECMNVAHMNATQKGEVNEQHQNVAKPIVQRYLRAFLTIHQETSQTTTQPKVVSVYHDDNHKPV